ncbi:hypothetical protein MCP_2073 [Methanocella paludicola SANAE]|uniref:AB hydrolase-1 domain-containing protein n=2 Tax=Methanocella TaxID=570266 RepID=D1Z0C3_METPS|nr:hypothetical protein MCP_2073 [Methanocella paludicola SANAE]
MKVSQLVVIFAACALAYLFSLAQLYGAYSGIGLISHGGSSPALELVPAGYNATIIIAHGYCADKEMMLPMGLALARNGYRVILYDSAGHGASSMLLGDEPTNVTMDRVADAYAVDNFSVAGHSMGSLAISYAMGGKPDACIGISPIDGAVNGTLPKNLLLLAGGADIESVKTTAVNAMKNGTGINNPETGYTYGGFSDGTARKLVILDGDNHITVLYDRRVYDSMLGWLDATYSIERSGGPSSYGNTALWFLLCALFAIIAFFPFTAFLSGELMGTTHEFRAPDPGLLKPALLVAGAAIAAAAITYFTGFPSIGIQLGNTVSIYLFVMGIIGLGSYWLIFRDSFKGQKFSSRAVLRPLALELVFLLYFLLFIGIPATASIYGLLPGMKRAIFIILMGAMLFPYNLLSELSFRGIPGYKSLLEGASLRIVAIALLMASILLSGTGGFFMVILPVLLPLFVFLEVLSYYTYRLSGNVLIGAILNSLLAAWLMASAFPLV